MGRMQTGRGGGRGRGRGQGRGRGRGRGRARGRGHGRGRGMGRGMRRGRGRGGMSGAASKGRGSGVKSAKKTSEYGTKASPFQTLQSKTKPSQEGRHRVRGRRGKRQLAKGFNKSGDSHSKKLLADDKSPKSVVVCRGKVTSRCEALKRDLRTVMAPLTAARLMESRSDKLSKLMEASVNEWGVTHLISLSQSQVSAGTHLRIIRAPNGPTFWFRVSSFSLIEDVQRCLHRVRVTKKSALLKAHAMTRFPALVILNGFNTAIGNLHTSKKRKIQSTESSKKGEVSDESSGGAMIGQRPVVNAPSLVHLRLMSAMFKHMFPAMNVARLKMHECKRLAFFDYNAKTQSVQFRHFRIKVNVTDSKRLSSGSIAPSAEVSAIRLSEIGPRMTLKLVKIEELVNGGRVLFHSLVSKTTEEVLALERNKQQRLRLKQLRRETQQQNVEKKRRKLEEETKQKEFGLLLSTLSRAKPKQANAQLAAGGQTKATKRPFASMEKSDGRKGVTEKKGRAAKPQSKKRRK